MRYEMGKDILQQVLPEQPCDAFNSRFRETQPQPTTNNYNILWLWLSVVYWKSNIILKQTAKDMKWEKIFTS